MAAAAAKAAPEKSSKADLLKPSFLYAITDGREFGPALEFPPPPQKIVDVDNRTIRGIKKG